MKRAWTFTVVGAMGFVLQLAVLWLLENVTALPMALKGGLAVEAAVLHNFVWHLRWTFADRRDVRRESPPWIPDLLRFHLSNGVVSLAGNLMLMLALTRVGLHYLVANVLSVAACSLLNFVLAERVVFAGGGSPPRRDARPVS